MKLSHKPSAAVKKTPLLIAFRFEEGALALPEAVELPAGSTEDVKGEARATSVLHASGGPARRVLAVGLGKREQLDDEGLRRAAAVAAKTAEELGVAGAVLWASDELVAAGASEEALGRALAEGAVMGGYRFDVHKTDAKPRSLKEIMVHGGSAALGRGIARGAVLAEANCFVRDLQNQPGNHMTPSDLAAAASSLAGRSERITCRVFDEKAMARMKMGLLLSVAQGSSQPPRLIHLKYTPKGRSKGRVAFVGKGLTFDAGGISIKPAAKMDEMRYDMSGGAAVLGVFHALAGIDLPFEVHGIVPSTENLINGSATKPGDVHTAMNGKTVEILNTDAEGRLILADALAYTAQKVKPDTIVDLATLTGAVIIALGHEVSGIFPSTDELREQLVRAGEETGERVWPLPLFDLHKRALKGTNADLKNIAGPDMGAGSTAGAAFLASFVEDGIPWCHIDIAGSAWGTSARDWVGGATGTGVGTRLLLRYLENRAAG